MTESQVLIAQQMNATAENSICDLTQTSKVDERRLWMGNLDPRISE